MQFPAGFKTFHTPLGFAFVVHTQKIAGIVPQKIGHDSHCSLDRGRQRNQLRHRVLLSVCRDLLQKHHPFQLAVIPDAQRV